MHRSVTRHSMHCFHCRGCQVQVLTCPCLSLSGSVPSLAAGLLFGSLAGLGAYQISNDPSNVWVSLGRYLCPLFFNKITCFCNKQAFRVSLHLLSYSHIRSSDWHHGKEVLCIQEVHASWFDGWSEVILIM